MVHFVFYAIQILEFILSPAGGGSSSIIKCFQLGVDETEVQSGNNNLVSETFFLIEENASLYQQLKRLLLFTNPLS